MVARVCQVLTAFIIAVFAFSFAVVPARADEMSGFLAQVNALRASNGLPALSVNATLSSDAQQWSNEMASTGQTGDDPSLTSQVGGGWTRLGENTAWGTSFGILFQALVNSPPHLANMLGDYSLTGVAVAVGANGWSYVTEIFELPSSASVTPTAPRTTPATAAAPVIRHTTVTAAPVSHPVTPVTAPKPTPATAPATTAPTTAAPTTSSTTVTTVVVTASGHTSLAPAAAALGSDNVALSAKDASASNNSSSTWILVVAMSAIVAIAGSGWLVTRRLPHSGKASR
ncbi:MAG TPA: CAP domain-containing protein [Acidimicrobiales bacterium]|jgi:hypothetical protein|nr:CAP domain-containing protein [Acidimicrobiales bacterium]